jgi:signal transduction protein with GAF and PtsI domain
MSKTNLQIVFWELANKLQAVQAVIYKSNKAASELEMLYTYTEGFAYVNIDNVIPEYAYGEGLIGQVAKDKRPMFINDIPEGYLKASSGLGAAHPNHILVYPILKDGKTLSVLEISTFVKLEEKHLEEIKGYEAKLLAIL